MRKSTPLSKARQLSKGKSKSQSPGTGPKGKKATPSATAPRHLLAATPSESSVKSKSPSTASKNKKTGPLAEKPSELSIKSKSPSVRAGSKDKKPLRSAKTSGPLAATPPKLSRKSKSPGIGSTAKKTPPAQKAPDALVSTPPTLIRKSKTPSTGSKDKKPRPSTKGSLAATSPRLNPSNNLENTSTKMPSKPQAKKGADKPNDKKVHPEPPSKTPKAANKANSFASVNTKKQHAPAKSKLAQLFGKSKPPVESSSSSPSPSQTSVQPSNAKTGGHSQGPHKGGRGRLGDNVIRMRDAQNNPIKFRKIQKDGTGGNRVDMMNDPLKVENIQNAGTYQEWKKEAQLALPSNVGVPVQSKTQAVQIGLDNLPKKKSRTQRATYNKIYDDAQTRLQSLEQNTGDAEKDKLRKRISMHMQGQEKQGRASRPTLSALKRPTERPGVEITYVDKIKAIRDTPQHMVSKRRQKLEMTQEAQRLRSRSIGERMSEMNHRKLKVGHRVGKFVMTLHRASKDFQRFFTIWKGDIHYIHGKYGMGAATYFKWLRTIVGLNIIQTILVFLFIAIPEINDEVVRRKDPNKTDDINQYLDNCPSHVQVSGNCFIIPFLRPVDVGRTKALSIITAAFTGLGKLQHSIMYYSGYRDTLSDYACPSRPHPRKTHASVGLFEITGFRFFLMLLFIFLINAGYLSFLVKRYYHNAEMESKVSGVKKKGRYRAIFSAWDFSVTHPEAVRALHRSIWRTIKLSLELENTYEPDPDVEADADHPAEEDPEAGDAENHHRGTEIHARRSKIVDRLSISLGHQKGTACMHVIIYTLIFLCYSLFGFIMFITFYARRHWRATKKSKLNDYGDCVNFIDPPEILVMLPAIFTTLAYFAVGYFCVYLSEFENWGSVRARNYSTVLRVALYYLISISIIYGYFLSEATLMIDDLICYEEKLGQEMYRLIFLQGFVYFTVSFFCYEIYARIRRWRDPYYTGALFDPVNYTMRLFYLHSLCGIGFFYCPLISVLVILRLVLTFYHHKRMLKKFYRLSSQAIQTSDLEGPFLIAYVLSFLMTSIMNALIMAELHPSTTCGPFSHYNYLYQKETQKAGFAHYYYVFAAAFKARADVNVFFIFITSSGFSFMLLTLAIAMVLTLRKWGSCYLHAVEKMNYYLQLERKDREFLLEAIFHFAKILPGSPSDQQQGGDEGGATWAQTDMAQGVFAGRNGAMVGMVNKRFASTATQGGVRGLAKPHEEDSMSTILVKRRPADEHGAVGDPVKDDFDWVPSQWKRRQRRQAVFVPLAEHESAMLMERFNIAMERSHAAAERALHKRRKGKKTTAFENLPDVKDPNKGHSPWFSPYHKSHR